MCHAYPHCEADGAPDRHPETHLTFAHSEPDGFSHGFADAHGLSESDTDPDADPSGGSCPAFVR